MRREIQVSILPVAVLEIPSASVCKLKTIVKLLGCVAFPQLLPKSLLHLCCFFRVHFRNIVLFGRIILSVRQP